MKDIMPDQIPDGWNKTSAAYNRDIWALMGPFVRDAVDRARIASGARVLDIAAGTGAVTLRVAPRADRVLAVDFARDMLAHLEERIARAGHTNVRTEVMDGQDLEVDDGSFDAVLSNFGVIFFPDRVRGFSEMHRVLRPGGRAVVTAWSTADRFDLFRFFLRAVHAALGEDAPRPKSPPPIFSLADRARLEEEMRAGGFGDVTTHTVRHTLEVESAEAYWEIMSKSAPPAVALLERVGPEAAARIRETLIAQLEEQFGDGPIRLSNEAHIGVGIRVAA
jgi:SAM-dependent methyltransferase